MIRKLRTQRDNQQWMLDLALNMRGRVQNFERDDLEVPPGKRARNYRMLPKVWREAAERHEALARRAQAKGADATATAGGPATRDTGSGPAGRYAKEGQRWVRQRRRSGGGGRRGWRDGRAAVIQPRGGCCPAPPCRARERRLRACGSTSPHAR